MSFILSVGLSPKVYSFRESRIIGIAILIDPNFQKFIGIVNGDQAPLIRKEIK
jgi:hypothetical protein